ncbi:SRPBCC family protein [Ruegeria sp. HKCCD8929]|uniref:SRPBCC family protein n=1 Tax=Ruegeria sp. HKCCD8929 TaxID=2683006 RepID=UPI001489EA53|nr:SRPBCC family protein [Ruegeria sp. HKCCD8929]
MHVFRSMIIEAPVAAVWSAVRAFDGVASWNPAVVKATMETGSATAPGSIRHLDISDGTVFRETLLELSDLDRFYTYDIIDSPLPVRNYVSTHRFVPITHTNQTLGIWESRFDCEAGQETELAAVVGDQIYVGGMTGLNDFLKGQRHE